ncbi:unnamed protein product [Rodentolepis nana]|uniref:Bromo domain-containing protein n=1 Tax=Rodentolepis nana TaxID=102285 RepID=A0A0R3TJR2_RODNA|nr:unnamed protein product [Rodentolepis nana]
MNDEQNDDSKKSPSEDHDEEKQSRSKTAKEEVSEATNDESNKDLDQQKDTDWFSLTSLNTELSTVFEPYPFGSDGAMTYEDFRAKLKEVPRSIIDYMGYVPNSVIRLIIGKWVEEYQAAEEMERRESGRKKLTIEEDGSIGSGEFVMTSKKDAQRLKKIRMETTQQILTQSTRPTASLSQVPPENATTYEQEEITNESVNFELEEDGEETTKQEIAGEGQPQILSRYEMDQIIAQIGEAIGGDDKDIGKLISGVLRGKASAINTFASIVPDQDIRADFLHTILEPGYIIFLLNCHFQSLQTILGAINIILHNDPSNSNERAALSERFLEILGETPDSEDSKLMAFVQALEKTCDLVVRELRKRVLKGFDMTDLKAQFKECLKKDDHQMISFANKVNISPIQLNDIIAMTLTCQYEALEEYLEHLPKLGKYAVEKWDEDYEKKIGLGESKTKLAEKSRMNGQAREKLHWSLSEAISEVPTDSGNASSYHNYFL